MPLQIVPAEDISGAGINPGYLFFTDEDQFNENGYVTAVQTQTGSYIYKLRARFMSIKVYGIAPASLAIFLGMAKLGAHGTEVTVAITVQCMKFLQETSYKRLEVDRHLIILTNHP